MEKRQGKGKKEEEKEQEKEEREEQERKIFLRGRRKVRKETLKTKTVGKSFLMRRVEETKSND